MAKIFMAALFLESLALAGPSCEIDIWDRKDGNYFNSKKEVIQKKTKLPLTAIKTKKLKQFDPQYGTDGLYTGFFLEDLFNNPQFTLSSSEFLLHFSNRMIVPIQKNQSIFLAFSKEWKEDSKLVVGLPEIPKPHYKYKDPRPIKFGCNKVVVSTPLGEKFNPFLHTDSLVGIEGVNLEAYQKQFLPNKVTKAQSAGFEVFLDRCQYCHGLHGVGSSWGWDYVEPLALYKRRDKTSLFYHVSHRPDDATPKGLMMPAQDKVTKAEINDLWEWMAAASTKPLNSYKN